MAFDKPLVVIDNGSRYIKAGFSCDNHPVTLFRNVIGRPKYLNGKVGKEYYDVLIGNEAVNQMECFDLSYPVQDGNIVHWDNMERVWYNIFYRELKVAPEDRSVILALSPRSTLYEKYKCCQVMFEILNVPALCLQSQSVLALYAEGITTGLSVDLGFDTVDINPVYEGRSINYANMQTGIAAAQIMNFVKASLLKRGIDLGLYSGEIIEDIIKNVCYVTNDASIPINKKDYERIYTLPSGEKIDVSEEAFLVAELLFQPKNVPESYKININSGLDNVHVLSIQESILKACQKCDAELREDLYDNIVTCGGLATLPGFNDRLTKELQNVCNRSIRLTHSPESYVLPWVGGANYASMSDAHQMWITKNEYEENAMNIIRTKCD